MVNATFTIGQKVMLKSGSPELTVIETGERTKVEWFDGLTVVSDTFPSVCLAVYLPTGYSPQGPVVL